ncbi:MAG: hypothetical protein ACKVTZ_21745 [Bacteroidia bacterium]
MKAWMYVLALLVGLNVQTTQAQLRKGAQIGKTPKKVVGTQQAEPAPTNITKGNDAPVKGGDTQTSPRPRPTADPINPNAQTGGVQTGGIKPSPTNTTGGFGKPRAGIEQILTPQELGQVQPVIVKNENGSTNWTDGYIEATGKCFIDRAKWKIPGQAEELSKTGADALARRNLLALISKVRIIDTVTLVNQVFDRQVTMQILDGYIKNAYRIGNYTITENYIEVTFRMNLLEGENSVAEAAGRVIEKAVSQGKTIAGQPTIQPNPVADAQIQAQLVQEMQNQGLNANNPLLLNVTNQNGQPSLFPSIKFVTEDGKEVVIPTAPFLNGNTDVKNAAQQAMPYFKLTKDILKQLNIKGQPLLNAIIDYDGSIKVNVKDQPKGAKIIEVLKKVGSVALKFLPTLVALF